MRGTTCGDTRSTSLLSTEGSDDSRPVVLIGAGELLVDGSCFDDVLVVFGSADEGDGGGTRGEGCRCEDLPTFLPEEACRCRRC